MIIAIDGPAGSGKSSVAKEVSRILGFLYLDTGSMYRAVAWRALQTGVSPNDTQGLVSIAENDHITFAHDADTPLATGVFIAGKECTDEIRSTPVDKAVSAVSAVSGVRVALVAQQRRLAAGDDVVIEGRDIGTVVFPDADLKVFLTADAEERARRRAAQNAARGFGETDAKVILADIRARDEADSSREDSPLMAASDAHILDTTGVAFDDVCARIVSLAHALIDEEDGHELV